MKPTLTLETFDAYTALVLDALPNEEDEEYWCSPYEAAKGLLQQARELIYGDEIELEKERQEYLRLKAKFADIEKPVKAPRRPSGLRKPISNVQLEEALARWGSQTDLARVLDVSQQAVHKWLRRGYCPIGRVAEVASFLNIDPKLITDPRVVTVLT